MLQVSGVGSAPASDQGRKRKWGRKSSTRGTTRKGGFRARNPSTDWSRRRTLRKPGQGQRPSRLSDSLFERWMRSDSAMSPRQVSSLKVRYVACKFALTHIRIQFALAGVYRSSTGGGLSEMTSTCSTSWEVMSIDTFEVYSHYLGRVRAGQ